MMNINPICERCGMCCKGYTFWMTGTDYDEGRKRIEFMDNERVTFWMENRDFDEDKQEIKRLMEYHGLVPLRREDGVLGVNVLRKVIQFRRNKEGELGIHIPGDCKHLDWVDNKAVCKIYNERPIVCREYACEKIIKKAILKEAQNGVYL